MVLVVLPESSQKCVTVVDRSKFPAERNSALQQLLRISLRKLSDKVTGMRDSMSSQRLNGLPEGASFLGCDIVSAARYLLTFIYIIMPSRVKESKKIIWTA